MKAIAIIMALFLVASASAFSENSCIGAFHSGNLHAEINDGTATITNEAGVPFTLNVASYEMHGLEDQVLYDGETVVVAENGDVTVELPGCAYQIAVTCEGPAPYNPNANAGVIAYEFGGDEFCDDIATSVDVTVADDFPQSTSYVFECNADGFDATSYSWHFGDGEKLLDSAHQNIYHTYEAGGEYTVSCTATDGSTWQTGTVDVDVVEPVVTVKVAPWYPKENHFVFLCEAEGFAPSAFDWEFQDGEKLYDQRVGDVYHIFKQNGEFQVTCAASDNERYVTGYATVSVDSCQEYELAITEVVGNQVSGILHIAGNAEEVTGEVVVVNGVEVGVFQNEWSAIVNESDIMVSFTSGCEQVFTAETTAAEDVEEVQQSVQVTTFNQGGDGGHSCWPGYHEVAGKCVKDAEVVLAKQEPKPEQVNIQEEQEPATMKKQVFKTVEPEPVDEQTHNFAWIIVALGLMALALGFSFR